MNSYVKIILWGVGGVLLTSLISMIITALICFILGGGEWFADIITALGLISSFISVTVAVLLRIKDEQNPDKPRNHISAGILALLLGGLGAHKYFTAANMCGGSYMSCSVGQRFQVQSPLLKALYILLWMMIYSISISNFLLFKY